MAKNEPNKPDEIKTEPAKELQTEEKICPAQSQPPKNR